MNHFSFIYLPLIHPKCDMSCRLVRYFEVYAIAGETSFDSWTDNFEQRDLKPVFVHKRFRCINQLLKLRSQKFTVFACLLLIALVVKAHISCYGGQTSRLHWYRDWSRSQFLWGKIFGRLIKLKRRLTRFDSSPFWPQASPAGITIMVNSAGNSWISGVEGTCIPSVLTSNFITWAY